MMVRAELMQRTLVLLVAAAMGSSCAGVHIVRAPAPWHELQSGHRVRVHLSQPRSKIVGYVVHLNADTLVINSEEDAQHEIALATANIRRLDLSRGERSRTGRGAFVGLLVGTVGGYLALCPSAARAASVPGRSSSSSPQVAWLARASAPESGPCSEPNVGSRSHGGDRLGSERL